MATHVDSLRQAIASHVSLFRFVQSNRELRELRPYCLVSMNSKHLQLQQGKRAYVVSLMVLEIVRWIDEHAAKKIKDFNKQKGPKFHPLLQTG